MSQAPEMRPFAWFAGLSAATLAGVGLLAAGPAWLWGGSLGPGSLGAALTVCWVGSLAGRRAQQGVFRSVEGLQRATNAVLAGLGVRMFVTLALALAVVLAGPFERLPFALWLLLGYLALLCLEVFVAMRELGQNQPPTRTGGAPEGPTRGSPEGASGAGSEAG